MKYNIRIYNAVCERRCVPCNSDMIHAIDMNPTSEVLNDFLLWEGIQGYTNVIMQICFPTDYMNK